MLKYVNTGIVFQEIPDEVTLAINISNCPCRCPGCHSHYLWDDVGLPLTTDAIDALVESDGSDITCIAFMGGDADPVGVNMLAQYVHEEYPLHGIVDDCVFLLSFIRLISTTSRLDHISSTLVR